MAAKDAGLSFEDFDQWSARGQKYKSERDCTKVWSSIRSDAGVKEGTLFYFARKNGWQEPTSSVRLPHSAAKSKREPTQKRGMFAPSNRNNSSSTVIDPLKVWQDAEPAPEDHPYIVKKQGQYEGLRVYPENAPTLTIAQKHMAGWLMVPCFDADGLMCTLQFISPCGEKLNLPKGDFKDGFYIAGDVATANRVFLVEGIGQAWAVRKATDDAAVVCFGAGRMSAVARVFRQRYPSTRLIILPDKGKEALAAEVARSVAGEWCELPADKGNNFDVNDLFLEGGSDAVRAVLSSTRKPPMRYSLIPAAELMNTPPMEWRVHGVLPLLGLAAIYGPSGSGKSFLALDLAASLSSGQERWFGHQTRQCPVTYVCLEGTHGFAKRLEAWRKRNGDVSSSLGFITTPVNLLSEYDVVELADAIKLNGRHNGLVIIDTLHRAAPNADENSSADMGRIISAASRLQELVGGLVILIHHSGKKSSAGLRGHSSLHAALDTIIEVEKSDARHSWTVAKCKDGEDGRQCLFRLESVLVGKDNQGLDVTSCIVAAESTLQSHPQRNTSVKRLRFTKNQKIARPILDEMLEESGEVGVASAPEGSSCVRYDDAVDAVSEAVESDLKHRKLRAEEAIDGLIRHGIYCSTGEWLWRS